jgi:hypothetical protein
MLEWGRERGREIGMERERGRDGERERNAEGKRAKACIYISMYVHSYCARGLCNWMSKVAWVMPVCVSMYRQRERERERERVSERERKMEGGCESREQEPL